MNSWSPRLGMAWTRTIHHHVPHPAHGANTIRSTVVRYPSRSCFTSPVLKSMTAHLLFIHDWMHLTVSKATTLGHSKLRKGQDMCIFIRRAIIPTTLSPSLSFIPRTPAVTRPWTLTVNPIEPSGFSFVALGWKRQARPFFETRTTWSSSVAAHCDKCIRICFEIQCILSVLLIRVYLQVLLFHDAFVSGENEVMSLGIFLQFLGDR